jgi:glycosyltransferase involved in cell wall biosynthesis
MDQALRIGYILDRYPARSETFIANEIRWLRELGVELTVFALTGDGEPPDDVPVVYARRQRARPAGSRRAAWGVARSLCGGSARDLVRSLRRTTAARRFAAAAADLGITHLHAHFASLPTTLAFMAAACGPLSVSFSAHARDAYVDGRGLARKLEMCRLCVTCCRANTEYLRALAGAKHANKVVCVHHGVNPALFRPRPPRRPASPARVLAVGRFVPKKGFDVLLRACAALKGRRSVVCRFVGNGPLSGYLAGLAQSLKVGDSVEFAGWVPYARMPAHYDWADVVAVPSVVAHDGDRDGLPNVCVEALANGIPVVAAETGGIPDAVRHEETGLLCEARNPDAFAAAMQRVLADRDLRERLVGAGRLLVESEFDGRRNARELHRALAAAAAG